MKYPLSLVVALFFLLIAGAVYYLSDDVRSVEEAPDSGPALQVPLAAIEFGRPSQSGNTAEDQQYVGSGVCAGCHQNQASLWDNSHHQKAMQHATTETVKGDFNSQNLTVLGFESRFYQRDGKFWVTTQGPAGKLEEYEVLYTFGVEPLQQYIVAFSRRAFTTTAACLGYLETTVVSLAGKLRTCAGGVVALDSGRYELEQHVR